MRLESWLFARFGDDEGLRHDLSLMNLNMLEELGERFGIVL